MGQVVEAGGGSRDFFVAVLGTQNSLGLVGRRTDGHGGNRALPDLHCAGNQDLPREVREPGLKVFVL